MKRFGLIPLAAVVAIGACQDSPTIVIPDAAHFELVSGGIARENANIEIVATFTHTIQGDRPYRESGDAVNPSGHVVGECVAGGAMRNPAGKITGARPHPHCMNSGAEELIIGLEPISGQHETYCHASCGNDNRRLADKVTFNSAGDMFVTYNRESAVASNWYMQAQGLIVAHAIDQYGNRHGTFSFDLSQFAGSAGGADLFDENTNIGTELDPVYVWGLDRAITATYTAPDNTETPVQGWIYWDEL
jgi:hypothetical protein